MISSRPSTFRRFQAAVVAVALVLQPLGAVAAPITTTLAEVPLQGLNPVKPNIMYTLDESDSVAFDYLPDYVIGSFGDINNWCRTGSAAGTKCQIRNPPYMSSQFNKLYYDPLILRNDIYVPYSPGKRENGANLPFQTPGSDPWTRVYKNGFDGYPAANPGDANPALTINLKTDYPDEVFCWKAPADITPDDLATANVVDGDGSVCRRNGKAYKPAKRDGYTAADVDAGYNYPNDKNTSTCGDNTADTKCVFGTRKIVTGNPYYYTISPVKFCPAPANSKGWGVDSVACTTRWSLTNKYVSYGAGGFDRTAFARIDIVPSTPLYPGGRTYAQEMDNFATWYAFGRTRLLALKTAGGIAFSTLDASKRVGFNTLNTFGTYFLNVQDFTPAYKVTWFTTLYSVPPTGGATPSVDAVWRIGEYFAGNGAATGLRNATDPLDPIANPAGKCQLNYHLLTTDGYWNQQGKVAFPSVDNVDGVLVPALNHLPGKTGFTPGQPFPQPYGEGPGAVATKDTMADLAMRYWINDIRSPTFGKSDLANQVQDLVAPWQHVSFTGLSLGAVGTFDTASRKSVNGAKGAPTSVADGAVPWPKPSDLQPTAIDDLWHAAVNGRGYYYNPQTPDDLARDTVSAVGNSGGKGAQTGAVVGTASARACTRETCYGYLTIYAPIDWSGDVLKYALDRKTGALPVGDAPTPPVWSARAQLDIQAADQGWDTSRRIVTIDDSTNTAVPFRLASLSASQRSSLNAGWSAIAPPPTQQAVLDYLRGDASHDESHVDVAKDPSAFRARSHILGDIVYSGAVPVGSPWDTSVSPPRPVRPYSDPGYAAFAEANKDRTPTVYVGANDGMLHAFDDSNTVKAGSETWAYVPKALFVAGDPNDSNHTPDPAYQLGALTFRQDSIPNFAHRFYVNATPRIWDVDFANMNTSKPPSSGNKWRTILVGGLGAGGRAVYALDVTEPVLPAETESDIVAPATTRVLWEFTDANLGHVYDAPTLVKTKRYGWVALVASGYNNPGGKGILYVLNPKDGTRLKTLSPDIAGDLDPNSAPPSEVVNDANPRGLSTIRAFTASRKDPYVLQAYGGDLKGNVWRFDLSDPDESKWKVALIAKLTDRVSGKAQPITTGVRVEIDQNNNVDRYLFVGTGKLLDQPDLGDDSVRNALYVIRDGTRTAAEAAPATPYSWSVLNRVDGTSVNGFADKATGRGWYQEAGDLTEKITTDVYADVQTVVYAFSKPGNDPCEVLLTSRLYARDFNTGASVLQSEGGSVVATIDDIGGIAGVSLIQSAAGASGSTGDIRLQVTTMKGQVYSFGVKLSAGITSKHRVSWRLINSQ